MFKHFLSRYTMSLFYIAAGLNHFINQNFYLLLIPPYFPYHISINNSSGIVEISFALLLLPAVTRKWAAYGIILMLIGFIPAHVYFIQQNSCTGNLCVPLWMGWIRLLIVHPVLLYWAWSNRK